MIKPKLRRWRRPTGELISSQIQPDVAGQPTQALSKART